MRRNWALGNSDVVLFCIKGMVHMEGPEIFAGCMKRNTNCDIPSGTLRKVPDLMMELKTHKGKGRLFLLPPWDRNILTSFEWGQNFNPRRGA